MNILVILAHPDKGSFNHAIFCEVVKTLKALKHRVRSHDLCAEKFDPILTQAEIVRDAVLPEEIKVHCREVSNADGIIFVHPNWWGQPPAIMKGWIDRVLRPGVAYQFEEGDGGEGVPRGLLRAKAVLIFNTSNTPAGREKKEFGDPLDALWRRCILRLCGIRRVRRWMFGVMVTSSPEKRKRWLREVQRGVVEYFPRKRAR